jgi:hypothetical protein
MAERTTKYLQQQGLQNNSFGKADRFDYANTVLIDYTGNKSGTLAELARIFHVEPANRLSQLAQQEKAIQRGCLREVLSIFSSVPLARRETFLNISNLAAQ